MTRAAASGRQRPRVVIGFPFGEARGGAERLLWWLLRDHEAAGIDPHLVTFEDGPFIEEVRALGLPVTVVDPGRFREPWRLAVATGDVARLLRRERPDLCVSWLTRVQTVLAPAATLAGLRRRIVYCEHQLAERADPLGRLALALPCASVIANSHGALASVRALWPHRDGVVIHPGVDVPPEPSARALEDLGAELALPADRPVVTIAGRLVGWKGQDRLIEAAGLLRDGGRPVSLLVVGDEAHGVEAGAGARLRDLVSRLDLETHVTFCGHVPDATPHMRLADVVVNASEHEPFGMVIVEAMALGVPVLAVARGGPTEIIEDGRTGVLVPSADPTDLADGLRALLDDPARARAIGLAGREEFARRFTVARWVTETGRALVAAAGR